MKRDRYRKPRRHMRTIHRHRLPHDIFRWEIHLDCRTRSRSLYPCMAEATADEADEIHELLKSSAAGRWKVVRAWSGNRRVIVKLLLERDSDAVLIKLSHTEPLYKVFRIVLPGEARSP